MLCVICSMLKKLIDQFYTDNFQEREKEYFYVTDAGKCPRSVYFNFKKVPKKNPEPRILRIFENGDYTHTRITNIFKNLGIVSAEEIRMPAQETASGKAISGRVDCIVNINDKPYIIEIKSIASYKFTKLKEPEPEHMKQVQLYMHSFKNPEGDILYEDSFVLYENKDKQDLKEFEVKYDPFLVQEILKDFDVLDQHIINDVVPPIPKGIEFWRCKYCQYNEECKKIKKTSEV